MPVIMDEIDENYEEEKSTNFPGIILGLVALPLGLGIVAAYIKAIWCIMAHVWHMVNF